MTEQEQLAVLKSIVDHQANLESLWGFTISGLRSINESLLQSALRHLHAVIEGDAKAAEAAKELYWHLEEEM